MNKFTRNLLLVIAVVVALFTMTITAFAEEQTQNVAKIGDTEYATLNEAIEGAKALTGDVEVGIYGKVTLTSSLTGSYDSIKFIGMTEDAEIYLDIQGYITATGKAVAFEDLSLSKSVGGVIYDAAYMNLAFGVYNVNSVEYTNCIFINGAYAASGNVTFKGCTFYRSHDRYGLWAYGEVDIVVDTCVFADIRGIKMYTKDADLTVGNTDFSVAGDKPAIVLTYGNSVTLLEGNTYSSKGTFELDLDGTPNGTPVTVANVEEIICENDNGACGVLVDGKIYTTVAQAAEAATSGSVVTLLHDSQETVEFAEGVTLDKNGYIAENVTAAKTGLKGSGTAEDPYLIESLEDLIWFRDKVDEQLSDGTSQFAGKYIKLTTDINLEGINWNPIGSRSGDHSAFKGVFDGGEHTISNLYVEQAGEGLGLFANTNGNAVIKNLNIHNVTLKSTDNSSYLGSVVGNAYANTYIENVHVTGKIDISGRGYLGGIAGHGYVVMDNVSVVGEGTIYSTFWCVGGILGYAGEGTTNIMNARVEGITITSAAGGLGAIVGMASDNKGTQPISGSNLSAKDVEIKTHVGAYGTGYANYALGYLYGGNPTSNLTGTIKVEDVKVETSTGEAPIIVDVIAFVGDNFYYSLADAINAAQAGETIVLNRNVVLSEMVAVKKTLTLDLNGYTITDTLDYNYYGVFYIGVAGNLTVNDSSENKSGAITSTSNAVFGNYGVLTINGGTYTGGTTVIDGNTYTLGDVYNYYYSESMYGKATINGGVFNTTILNCGSLDVNGGQFAIIDNSGSLTVDNAQVENLWARDGSDAAGVANAGSVTVEANATVESIWFANAEDVVFYNDPSEIAPEGYIVVKNEDNTYSFAVPVPVAQIGDTYYTTLADALANANGNTVVLLDNIVLDAGIVIEAGKEFTLDLNGHTISYESNTWNDHMITNRGTLTIDDSVGGGAIVYKFVGEADTSYGKSNTTIVNTGTLTINNGTIQNKTPSISHAFYAIDSNSINSNASLTINDGKIICDNSRAIRLAAGKNNTEIIVNGGEIDGKTATIYVQMFGTTEAEKPSIAVEINGGVITSNQYAFYTYSYGASFENTTVDITNGTFNGYVGLNGGVNKTSAETVTITGGYFNSEYGVYSFGDYELAVKAIAIKGGTFINRNSEAYATDDGYEFESYVDSEGNTVYGVVEKVTVKLEDVFTYLGYSINNEGDGITVGYILDNELYAKYCEQNNVTPELGMAFGVDEISVYESYSSFGVAKKYNATINGLTEEHHGLNLVMAIYVSVEDEKKFVTGLNKATVVVDASGVEAVTYNSLKGAN